MMRVIAMILLSLLPGILSAKVATDYLRDYQGNNRLTYTETGVVLERNDYYPYGGLFGEEQSLHPYKYSGKELETTNGLNLYDFHARYHDYTLPIFTTQDPQQEKYYDLSPYIYCAGNPIMHIDPTGEIFESLWDVANVGIGISSLWNNIRKGNVRDAVVDGIGVAIDVAAVILPGIPGGASSAIKSARAADEVVDAVADVAKAATKTTNETTDVAKAASKVADKTADGVKMEKHHIIPQQYKSHPLVQDAINEGFKFNGQENIISLEKYSKATNQGRHGNHPAYSDQIETQLDLHSKGEGTATERINSIINKARTDIEAQPNVKINDLFKTKK